MMTAIWPGPAWGATYEACSVSQRPARVRRRKRGTMSLAVWLRTGVERAQFRDDRIDWHGQGVAGRPGFDLTLHQQRPGGGRCRDHREVFGKQQQAGAVGRGDDLNRVEQQRGA